MEEIVSYKDRLHQSKNRLKKGWTDDKGKHHKILTIEYRDIPPALSKSILINQCPYCEYERKCYNASRYSDKRRICLIRSTQTIVYRLHTAINSNKIILNKQYGALTVIKFDHKDKKGNMFFSCLCQCGKTTIVRSDHLLSGNTTSCGCLSGKRNKMQSLGEGTIYKCKGSEYSNKVTPGSMRNPDHSRHVYATEHRGQVGKKIDKLVEIKYPDHPEDNYKYYVDKTCDECGGILRINSRAEQECERCNLV